MQIKELEKFCLVGGTALALKYGHRSSIDIDLFYHNQFEHSPIVKRLIKTFGKGYAAESKDTKWGIFCYLDDVKVDIVYYPHLLISQIEVTDNIRLYSDPDIIAMKLNAILGRGTKKDFWDLYQLFQHYSLEEMISFHEKKFPEQNLLITIPQAITYFEDADATEPPVSFKGQRWHNIKKFIQRKVNDYLK